MQDANKSMLVNTGKALYGDRWQTDIGRDLGVDSRRVRQWLASERPIPPGVWNDLVKLLNARKLLIEATLEELKNSATIQG